MSFLSKIMKPIRKGLAPTSRRNMGGLEPRTPMPPKRKGGVVNIGGNYYPQVTGSLQRSIGFEKVGPLSYRVGSAQGFKNCF